MNEPQLGRLIEGDDAQRDAIHIAIIPLIIGEDYMQHGERFRLKYGSKTIALSGEYENGATPTLGILDPFIDTFKSIMEGQKVWGFLFPGTVTGMRHHWKHPSFDKEETPENIYEVWLREFADKWNFNFSQLIEAGIGEGKELPYVVANGFDLHTADELEGDEEKFWYNLEMYTKKNFSPEHRKGLTWSCTC